MKIIIKDEFRNDWITREAGGRLREILLQKICEKKPVILDFIGLTVASTSFFDEGIAKLSEEGIEPKNFTALVSLVNLHPRDRQLLASLCKRRGFDIQSLT